MSQQDSQNQEDSTVSALMLVRDVLYGNRDNVNFVHELYRQAFLLDFNHAGAIRKAIAVYKDWIQMNVSFVSIKITSVERKLSLLVLCFYVLCRRSLRLCWNHWMVTRIEIWRSIKEAKWKSFLLRIIDRRG